MSRYFNDLACACGPIKKPFGKFDYFPSLSTSREAEFYAMPSPLHSPPRHGNTEYLFTWISLRHLGNHIGGHVSLPCKSSEQPSFCVFFTRYHTPSPFTLARGDTNLLRIYTVFRESTNNENCPTTITTKQSLLYSLAS